jgi:hypothetical protein
MDRDFMARLQVIGLAAMPLTVAIFDDLINRILAAGPGW